MSEKRSGQDLFEVYPALRAAIDDLCSGKRWYVTGTSTVLHDRQGRLIFELTKPKHWRLRAAGVTEIGIGGIGGTVEDGEAILDALHRELFEELGASADVHSSASSHLVYEQSQVASLTLPKRASPRPAFFTVSANLYRQLDLPEFPVLAIATFEATLTAAPILDDLYGIVAVPRDIVRQVFADATIVLETLRALPGIEIVTQQPPEHLAPGRKIILRPTWTGRSYQILLQRGLICV